MKKARVLLGAAAVVAIVAGASAFKAHQFSDETFFSFSAADNSCDAPFLATPTTSGQSIVVRATLIESTTCPIAHLTTAEL